MPKNLCATCPTLFSAHKFINVDAATLGESGVVESCTLLCVSCSSVIASLAAAKREASTRMRSPVGAPDEITTGTPASSPPTGVKLHPTDPASRAANEVASALF